MHDPEGEVPNSMGPLTHMQTLINGRPVESTVRYGYVRASSSIPWLWLPADSATGRRIGWHVVRLDLPPNGTLELERRYRTDNGGDGIAGTHFYYITLTGGPWLGPIDSLSAQVELEDGLTVHDLDWRSPDSPAGIVRVSPPRDQWVVTGPSSLSLTWRQFEPVTDNSKHVITLVWRPRDLLEGEKSPNKHLKPPAGARRAQPR